MTQLVGTSGAIDPEAYRAMFDGHRVAPPDISGVCGRVVRGKAEADFAMLAYADGRRLAWVTGPAGLRSMIGREGADIVVGIGKSRAWLREKLEEGMRWRLLVLPQAVCTRADWAGVFALIEQYYPEISGKLLRWKEALQAPALTGSVDPALVLGAVKDATDHPDHMSVSRYRDCTDTAMNARLFLWHSLGLNQHFIGDGWAKDPLTGARIEEYLTGNVRLADIAGHRMIALDVRP